MTGRLRIDSLVVKIAELCNLNCRYCYLYNHGDTTFKGRPRFMSDTVFDGLLKSVWRYCEAEPGRAVSITFHGGEPTLVGPRRLVELAARARATLGPRLGSLQMQTNGTLIDERWVDALRTARVHASVSLDGPADIHDRDRVDHLGRGSHQAATRGLRLLQEAGLAPGVLAVIAPGEDGGRVYRHFRELGVTSMDFLLPDVTHDTRDSWYGAAGPTPVAKYLVSAFDAWFDEDNPDIVARVLYGLLRKMMGGDTTSDAFGNGLHSYLIVDTDGSIQPNDAAEGLRARDHRDRSERQIRRLRRPGPHGPAGPSTTHQRRRAVPDLPGLPGSRRVCRRLPPAPVLEGAGVRQPVRVVRGHQSPAPAPACPDRAGAS